MAAHLIGLLDSPEFTVRAWAARGLGEARRADAVGPLEARLETEERDAVVRQIQRAIDRIREDALSSAE